MEWWRNMSSQRVGQLYGAKARLRQMRIALLQVSDLPIELEHAPASEQLPRFISHRREAFVRGACRLLGQAIRYKRSQPTMALCAQVPVVGKKAFFAFVKQSARS
jgi:hypothetical protein